MSKNPVTYVKNDGPAYIGGVLYKAGEPFVTADTPPDGAEKISVAEKAAIDAADPLTHDDVAMETLSVSELRAVAATKKVDFEGLNKKELLAAIKAADEPAL
jgi:hypothetical protein